MHQKQEATLYPQDIFLKKTIIPFIPLALKPNHITIFRMAITPAIIACIFLGWHVTALVGFVIAVLSDILDGVLARVRNLITPWGIFFDPIADKLLIGSVALTLAIPHYPWWLLALVLFLDLIPPIRWFLSGCTESPITANFWGKTKMVLQSISLILLFLGLVLTPIFITVGMYVLGVAVFFAVIALVTYSL